MHTLCIEKDEAKQEEKKGTHVAIIIENYLHLKLFHSTETCFQ